MVLISFFAIVFALLVTLVAAKKLYSFSLKNNKFKKRKDYIVNAVILAFVFFCVSSFIYVFLINVIL